MKFILTIIKSCFLILFVLSLSSCSKSDADIGEKSVSAENSVQGEPLELDWMDLMPDGEDDVLEKLYSDYYAELNKNGEQSSENFDLGSITEGAANDTMEQIGTFNVVKGLNGKNIRIPGYVVPLDFNAQSTYKQFLLVPYFGACLHTPPPPPNQIVFVTADEAAIVENINEPVWLEGILKTGEFKSDLASTAYELSLSKLEPYDY